MTTLPRQAGREMPVSKWRKEVRRARAGKRGCATSPTWNPYIILRILEGGGRRGRAAELSLTISSFGLSEKFAGRRERSTVESVTITDVR